MRSKSSHAADLWRQEPAEYQRVPHLPTDQAVVYARFARSQICILKENDYRI